MGMDFNYGMRERYFSFKATDGQIEILTLAQALKHSDPAIKSRVQEIRQNLSNVKRKQDGFQPGWQENIQAYCGDRRQYNDALKERGLVEIGNEKIPEIEKQHSCANEGFIDALTEAGLEVSGEEAKAIVSGELFKDETVN